MARVSYEVTIRGIRTYLHHRFGPNAIPLEKKERRGVPGNDPGEWRDTVFVVKATRQLYIPIDQIRGSIIAGSRFTKKGRGSIQRDMIATLILEGPEKVLVERYLPEGWETEQLTDDDSLDTYLDVRMVKRGTGKAAAANVRYRVAIAPGWEGTFQASFDTTIVQRSHVEASIIDAGTLCGVGDGRTIGLGRFELVSFKEITD